MVQDYRFLNSYTHSDALPIPRTSDVVQKIAKSHYISTFDAKSGYWQVPVKQSDQYLTAFVCDEGVFEFSRAPFGLKGSGNTFVRNLQLILEPIRDIAFSYVDDIAVGSNDWDGHLVDVERFLKVIKESGLTLSLKKTNIAQNEVRFVGVLVGSGKHRVDPDRVKSVEDLKAPKTKKEVRQIVGFFSFFRDYIPDLSGIAKPITDLTGKHIPNRVPWGLKQDQALSKLKELLKIATLCPLQAIDSKQSFTRHVDASDDSVAGVLTQLDIDGKWKPVSFASSKLSRTQRAWAIIEREAYAVVWAMQKFRHWIFGSTIYIYSDHNPLTYLTNNAPKNAKLMRWALSSADQDIIFRYKSSEKNAAADALTRLMPDN